MVYEQFYGRYGQKAQGWWKRCSCLPIWSHIELVLKGIQLVSKSQTHESQLRLIGGWQVGHFPQMFAIQSATAPILTLFCSKGFQSTWTNQCDLWKWLVKNNRSFKYLKIWGFVKFPRFHQFHYSAFRKAPTSDTETLLFDDGNWSSDHTTRYNKGYCTDAILGVFTGIILLLMTQAIQAGQSLSQGQQRTRNFFPVQVFVSFSFSRSRKLCAGGQQLLDPWSADSFNDCGFFRSLCHALQGGSAQ